MGFRNSLAGVLLYGAFCISCAGSNTANISNAHLQAIAAADIALASGDVDGASRAYDAILAETPDLPRALLGGARASLAAGDGIESLARFAAYRAQGESWEKVEQWEYCAALDLGTRQRLATPSTASTAIEFAARLEGEGCRPETSKELVLRSELAVSDAALRAGDVEQALAGYLALIGPPGSSNAKGVTWRTSGERQKHNRQESPRERAFLTAARLLSESGEREQALALLSRGLDEFPANRDLVHRMVTLLADGSSVVFPRAKPPGGLQPASTP
jgi:tetratricopeptide (TPR) repeat protein